MEPTGGHVGTRSELSCEEEPKMVKLNIDLDGVITSEVEALLWEYKDVFTWSYRELIKITPHIAQHQIELDTTNPPTHQARY